MTKAPDEARRPFSFKIGEFYVSAGFAREENGQLDQKEDENT